MNSPILILLTNDFPFGQGEQFLETEILHLSKSFDKVYIYTTSSKGERRYLPSNVEVKNFHWRKSFSVKKLILRRVFLLLKIFFAEFWSPKRKQHYKRNLKFHFNNLLAIINDAENFKTELDTYDLTSTKIYSYWFGPWGDVMCMVNASENNKYPFITRVHGYDYDVARWEGAFIPFRAFFMQHVNQMSAVSEYGYHRVITEYPEFKNISVSRLGVTDKGDNLIFVNDVFHIVSCSSLIPLKRVHLIIEIIKQLPFKVKWTHFGDGPLKDSICSLAEELPESITVDFKGFVANEVVIDFYKSEQVDLFMNVSELEGVPVSIMEAISFGIPATGCRICGVPEIVTDHTGLLFEEIINIDEAVNQIVAYKNLSESEKIVFRKGVKTFWRMKFDANFNYSTFITEILQ